MMIGERLLNQFASLFVISTRTSLENPSTSLANPDAWLYEALGAKPSTSGLMIDSKKALMLSAVWRAVSLLASSVARIPCYVYKRVGEGKELDKKHFAFKLIRRKPNSEMNAVSWKKALMGHVLLRGNHYCYIDRARAGMNDGQALELIPLDPQYTYPVRENGRLLYVTRVKESLEQNAGYENRKILPENMLHIKGLGYDGLVGYDVLEHARNSIGLGLASEEYGSRFFANNAEPSVVIETPKTLSAKARAEFKQEWNSMHQGLNQSHKIALLQEGASIKPFSITARQSQLLETREFELKSVANWFGIPVHKVGSEGRTSYNSLEMENQSFLDESLDPWLVDIEEELWDKLLTEEQKEDETHTIEFLRNAVVRADIQARYAAYQVGIQYGIMTANEIRAKENMNPIEGGDELAKPANIFGDGSEAEGGEEDEPPEQEEENEEKSQRRKDAERRLLCSCVARALKRIGIHARRAAEQPGRFGEWLDGFQSEHRVVITSMLHECSEVVFGEQGQSKTDELIGSIFGRVRKELDACYSTHTEKTFAVAVGKTLDNFEGAAAQFVDAVL